MYTNASNHQIGACIMQDNHPVPYDRKKLNSAQHNHATIDKELLCVVTTYKKIRSILLGAEYHIYTHYKNILNVDDMSEGHLYWISYVDEDGRTLQCMEGPRNVIADTLFKTFMQRCALNLSEEESRSVTLNLSHCILL
jgi:hypothetical protein